MRRYMRSGAKSSRHRGDRRRIRRTICCGHKIPRADWANVSRCDGYRVGAGRAGRSRSAGVVRRRRGRPVRIVRLRRYVLRWRIRVAIFRVARRRTGRTVIRAITWTVIRTVVWSVIGSAVRIVIRIVGIRGRVVARIVRRFIVVIRVPVRVVRVSGPIAVRIGPAPIPT